MILFVTKRLLYILGILIAMSMLIFAITQILPGSVAHMILGQFASEESIRLLEAKMGSQRSIASAILAMDKRRSARRPGARRWSWSSPSPPCSSRLSSAPACLPSFLSCS